MTQRTTSLHLTPGSQGPVVISHRLASLPHGSQRRAAADQFQAAFHQHLAPHLSRSKDGGSAAPSPSGRHVFTGTADHDALIAHCHKMPSDLLIEPLRPRQLARARPAAHLAFHHGGDPAPAGEGATFTLRLVMQGMAYPGGKVDLSFLPRQSDGNAVTATVSGSSDAAGFVHLAYDPTRWIPALVILETLANGWNISLLNPAMGQTIEIAPLPLHNRLGWWHLLTGQQIWSPTTGGGITVGIVDSGAGPHPALDHVMSAGAFINGGFTAGPDACRDQVGHGSHVCGIIGARPPLTLAGFGGLAPGAALVMACVTHGEADPIGQGDIAQALETLSLNNRADLINLSIAGEASEIERDAVQVALNHGTLILAASGNDGADAISYPADYPETLSIGALGLADTVPANAVAAANVPTDPGSWGVNGLFRASFSNRGQSLTAVASGNGILSTLPARDGFPAPYGEMSGTSMATPMATGALAARLSADPFYLSLPRDARRSTYAAALFTANLAPVGLSQDQQGGGMVLAG